MFLCAERGMETRPPSFSGFRGLIFLHLEICAKVDFADGLVCKYVFAVTAGNNYAVIDDKGIGRNFQSIADIVVCYKNSYSLIGKVFDNLLYFINSYRVDTGERFVQKKEFWFDSESAGNFGTPPLAARQCITELLAYAVYTEILDKLLQPLFF